MLSALLLFSQTEPVAEQAAASPKCNVRSGTDPQDKDMSALPPKAVSHASFGHLVAGKIGKAMWKIEPRGWAGAAVSSPECRSMIIRQSASPNPIPWDFVVTNASSKMFFACFGS